jgi:NADH-quinone oxidoreductase subunit J
VVVLFLFVIMLLGPTAVVVHDSTGRVSRFFGAGLLVACGVAALALLANASATASRSGAAKAALGAGPGPALFPAAPPALGTIEGVGRELFTTFLVPFELSAALLLVAIVGAVAVARGKQPDPTVARNGHAEGQRRGREESHT